MNHGVNNDVEITLRQVIHRADGTIEDLGVTASTADGSIRVQSPGRLRVLLQIFKLKGPR